MAVSRRSWKSRETGVGTGRGSGSGLKPEALTLARAAFIICVTSGLLSLSGGISGKGGGVAMLGEPGVLETIDQEENCGLLTRTGLGVLRAVGGLGWLQRSQVGELQGENSASVASTVVLRVTLEGAIFAQTL